MVASACRPGSAALANADAISSRIPAFREPEADNTVELPLPIVALLAPMSLGLSFLARPSAVAYVERETVILQIGRQVFGEGPLYLVPQVAANLIITLVANTSLADSPRQSAIPVRDRYLPRQPTSMQLERHSVIRRSWLGHLTQVRPSREIVFLTCSRSNFRPMRITPNPCMIQVQTEQDHKKIQILDAGGDSEMKTSKLVTRTALAALLAAGMVITALRRGSRSRADN